MREVSFPEEKRKSLSPEAEAHLGHTGPGTKPASQSFHGVGLSKLTVHDLKKPAVLGGSLVVSEDTGSGSRGEDGWKQRSRN